MGWRVSGMGVLATALLVALAFCASVGGTPPNLDRGPGALTAPYAGRAVATLSEPSPAYRNRDTASRALRDRAEPKKKSPALAAAAPRRRSAAASVAGRKPAIERVQGFGLLRRQRARAPPVLTPASI